MATLEEMRRKAASLKWARKVVADLDAGVRPWLDQPLERIEALLPRRKMQVYWLMFCPDCMERLPFDPFNDRDVACRPCGKTFPLDQRPPASDLRDGTGRRRVDRRLRRILSDRP